jgi:hypothetical protein
MGVGNGMRRTYNLISCHNRAMVDSLLYNFLFRLRIDERVASRTGAATKFYLMYSLVSSSPNPPQHVVHVPSITILFLSTISPTSMMYREADPVCTASICHERA